MPTSIFYLPRSPICFELLWHDDLKMRLMLFLWLLFAECFFLPKVAEISSNFTVQTEFQSPHRWPCPIQNRSVIHQAWGMLSRAPRPHSRTPFITMYGIHIYHIYLQKWVDCYGFHVGRYISCMDSMGNWWFFVPTLRPRSSRYRWHCTRRWGIFAADIHGGGGRLQTNHT